ncbi:hypothetical protein HDU79_010182 [Rhizoclosmatium sp. JEL0117]|nr:hypothetical protein HDU79_010182 [Rhizoclosmatium sp. JEL0117]
MSQYFVLGVLGLTLPSLISQNYHELGLASPPLSPGFISKSMLLRIAVTPSLADVRVVSPLYTLVTHAFHHRDVRHWASNAYALAVVGTSDTTPGFVSTFATFFGGVLGGVVGQAAWATLLLRPRDQLQPSKLGTFADLADSLASAVRATIASVSDALPFLREQHFVLCGMSAGVYALMGAECVALAVRLTANLRALARLQNRPYRDAAANAEIRRLKDAIVGILSTAIGHAVALGSQVIAVASLWPQPQQPQPFALIQQQQQQSQSPFVFDESVGYAAHLGGFAVGLCMQLVREMFL